MSKVFFPNYHKYLTFLKKVYRHEFRKNGFRRISIPIIVDGKMRTNAREGIMKAYLNNNIIEEIQPVYYYYMGCFECDGSEDCRIGGDILGENDPILDFMLIYVNFLSLTKMGLGDDFEIRLNTTGIEKEKLKFREELINFYSDKKHILTEEGLKLLEEKPELLLKSENEDEKILAAKAPNFLKFLKKDSKAHYEKVKEYLDLLEIPYIEDNGLVGEKDYNTNTIWSFVSKKDGKIISSGYRYNTLSTQMGAKKEVPASGFYTKTKVVIDILKDKKIAIRNKDSIDLFIVQLGDEAKKVVLPISIEARAAGINTVVSLGTPSMKEQMLKAQRSEAKYIVMVGIMEARNGMFQVRDIEAGTQEEVKKEELINYIIGKIGEDKLDFYSPIKDLLEE